MNILVLGSGMYVTGRHGTGSGTILSSLAQSSKEMEIERVFVASKSPSSAANVQDAIQRINAKIGTSLKVEFIQLEDDFRTQLQSLKHRFGIDVAIVSLPDHLHFSYTKTLLEESIHCLVVKPLTPTLREAQELIAIQEKQGVYGCVELHKRYDETNLYVKRALSENALGDLLYFTVDYSQRISIPSSTFKEWAHQTNIFQYLGIHYVDLIFFLTGALPQRVMAVGTHGILRQMGIETYDSVHATVEWKTSNGHQFLSLLNLSWVDANVSSALSDQKYKVIGTLGRLECEQKNRGLELVTDKTGIQHVNPYFSDYLPDGNGGLQFSGYGHTSIRTFLRDVLDLQNQKVSLANLQKHKPSFQSAIPSTAIVDAVNESLKAGSSWVATHCQ